MPSRLFLVAFTVVILASAFTADFDSIAGLDGRLLSPLLAWVILDIPKLIKRLIRS